MSNSTKIKQSALQTLTLEAQAVEHLTQFIDDRFEAIANLLLQTKGRLVVTGIGKSANIAQKLVATFISTGQPAVFMHAADAIHGDLGTIQKDDVVLCISKSGDSPEIKVLVPLIKSLGNLLIGMVSNMNGYLALQSDHVLQTTVEKEACPNNLAPTTSTTAQLAMGDALAVALMECRGFSSADFARYHPGGALGKKLYVRMGDLVSQNAKPQVALNTPIREAIIEISSKRLGAAAVINSGAIAGVITDGDIRRMLEKNMDLNSTVASDIMGKNPKTIDADELAVNGFHVMESNQITQLIVTNQGEYMGIVHLHDILKEGIF